MRSFWHTVHLEQAQDNALPPVAEKLLFHFFKKKAGLRPCYRITERFAFMEN